MRSDGSPENVRRSIEECLKVLDGKKKIDLFECARVDPAVPYEESVGVIAEYVKAGKIGGISISEVSASQIREAAKSHKIEAVEVEFSLICTDILENGIAETCHELNIPILAYSPLCRGFLTGWKTPEDVYVLLHLRTRDNQLTVNSPQHLQRFPRFQGDAFYHNRKLVDEVERIAKEKGVTVPQVALGWITALSGKNGLPTIIPIPGATTVSRVEENMKPAELSDAEVEAINSLTSGFSPVGPRYPAH